MATSTTELVLRFRGDSGDLKSTMAQVRAELKQTATTQTTINKGELSMRQQLSAAQSLQRQRSAALIAEFKKQETAAKQLSSGIQPLGVNLQRITDVMQALGSSTSALQGPMGGVASRIRSVGALATEAGGGLGILGVAIGAVAVAAVGASVAIFKLATAAAEFQGKMFDLSQQTGISVETLSALEIVARTTGGSIETIAASLGIFQRNLEQAQDSTSKEAELLAKLGVETTNTETALRQTLAALAAMPEGFTQTSRALELFGRGGKSILAILKEMDGDLDGAIKQFRAMGILIDTDTAKAADKFNDQLTLVQFQMRATAALIGNEAMPDILRAIESFSRALTENRSTIVGWVREVGDAARGVKELADGIVFLAGHISGLSSLPIPEILNILGNVSGLPAIFRGLKQLGSPTEIAPITVPGITPTSLTEDPAEQSAKEISALRAASEEAKRIASDRIAETERAFKLGQITRAQETENIITQLKIRAGAETAALTDEIGRKLKELEATKDNADKRAQIITAISNLNQQVKTIESEVDREAANKRAEIQVQEQRDLLEHEGKKRDILISGGLARIAVIESEVRAGVKAALQGNAEIEQIESEAFDTRRAFLEKQLELAGREPSERRKILDLIDALEQERTTNLQKQTERRKEIERNAAQHSIDIQLANIDTLIRLGQISDTAQIASLQALAQLRIRTEEQTAKEILAIRIAAIDRETDAINARLTATKTIADPLARAKEEAQLNSQLKILAAERTAIQNQGERDVEESRQRDLDNERKYAGELLQIRRRVVDIQRDTAQTIVGLMVLNRAPKRDVIKAQAQLEIQDELDRHARVQASIEAQKQENLESNRTYTEQAEIQAELNRQKEAEEERHNAEMLRLKITRDEALRAAGPEGGFLGGLATGQLAEFENGIKSFADVAVVAFSAVGAVVGQLAQGLGSLIQNWVLLGNTGPGAMKKMVASVLAGVAAQSAVLAIFELAKGFAALFFNPAEAAAHFTAAALFGSIALATAVAGRAIAGNSFQTQTATAGGGAATGNGSGSRGADYTAPEPRPVQDVNRIGPTPIQGNATLTLQVPEGWFEREYRRDFDLNGFSRLVLVSGGRTG